jgi:hypothetical protein
VSEIKLVPCPVCGKAPNRFFVGRQNIEVIACPKGCQPHIFSFVVHITSELVRGCGWTDLGDAWNTIRLEQGDDGNKRFVFDRYAPGCAPIEADGPHIKWSPAISTQMAAERAAIAKAAGSAQ